MPQGRLFLIPVPLKKIEGPVDVAAVLPAAVCAQAKRLTHFVAENAKSARAFLKALPSDTPLQQIEIAELNEHTQAASIDGLLAPLRAGFDVGLVSEAGCPAVADPGAELVARAHAEGILVLPMIGPSSILLALMGSGLSGQNFAFHGYLPSKEELRQKRIRELEKDSRLEKRTQIFIETPYRNMKMLEDILSTCQLTTKLCIAADITLETEFIRTKTIKEWKALKPDLNKRPCIFLIYK